MDTKETIDEGNKTNSTDFGFAPMGRGMREMMKECCTGRGGFPDCSPMMKGMMEAMGSQPCCTPKTEDTFEGPLRTICGLPAV
jgi:hypothetical protein